MKTLVVQLEEMYPPVFVLCLLAAAWPAALCQNPVPIQFQTSPVLVQTGTKAVLTVVTIPNALSVTWVSPTGTTLGLWAGGQAVLGSGVQYGNRITITATQLQISPVLLTDAGNYTITVDPGNVAGMARDSRSVQLSVFDAVQGVQLSVPSIAVEGGNISLSCTWAMGTETSTIWGKGGAAISPNYRITVTGNSLVINTGNRSDAGVYSCTVSNPISALTATASLTVYYGPDAPILQLDPQANCVGGGQAVVGQTVRLTCTSVSLPPALFSWQQNGQSVAADQVNGGVLTLQGVTANQSGRYVCMARNTVTTRTAVQGAYVTTTQICLSDGAVAGIAVGCGLALIFIIFVVILLLCCRNRVRALGGSKPNPSSAPAPGLVQPTAQSTHQQYARTSLPPQPNGPHTHGPQGNPLGPLSNQELPDRGGLPPGGPCGPGSRQNQTQTGHTAPGSAPPLIHLTLNTIQPAGHAQNNGQPQAFQLNLNAYPHSVQPSPLQNSNVSHLIPNGNEAESGLPPAQPPAGADSAPPVHASGVESQGSTQDALVQTGFTHFGRTRQQDARTQTYCSEPGPPSRPRRPWNWLHSTPAYPNRSATSQSGSSSSSRSSPEQSAAQLGKGPQSLPTPAARGPRAQTAPQSHSQTHVSTHTQTYKPGPQLFTTTGAPVPQIQTAPQNPDAQTQAALPAQTAKPRNPFQTQNQPTQPVSAQRTKPSARQPPTPPPVLPLSQFKALPRQPLPEPRPIQQLRPQRKPHPKRTVAVVQPRPHWNAVHGPAHMHGPTQVPAQMMGQHQSHIGMQKQVFRSRMRY